MNTEIKYTVTAQHFTLSPEVESQVKKTVAALQKYVEHGDESAMAHFIIRFERRHTSTGVYIVEVDFHGRNIDRSAHGEKETVIAALDEAKEELSRSLRIHKEKRSHFVRKTARRVKDMFKNFSR